MMSALQSARPEHTMAPLWEVLTAHDALIRVAESRTHEIPTPELGEANVSLCFKLMSVDYNVP